MVKTRKADEMKFARRSFTSGGRRQTLRYLGIEVDDALARVRVAMCEVAAPSGTPVVTPSTQR
jgi:hypothetical protein